MRLFETVGLDAHALFRQAGIDPAEIDNSDARFLPEQISTVWDVAVARTGNPYLGLAMPDMAHPGSFDVVVHVMMACPNLLSALDRFLRYIHIVSDAAEIELESDAAGYGLTFNLAGNGHPVPRARVEFVVLTILNILRWLTGLSLRPKAVDFPYPEPDELLPYQTAFRCPLRFNARIHRIHFSRSDLMAPLPTANSALVELNDRLVNDHLTRLGAARISVRARQIIVRRLPDGDPLRADVARIMCMSERTLQRRLQEEGTSFNDLVDDARRELADQYLRSSRITLAQAAYLLGFADQSTFFRACKRWFGTSPREYRLRLATGK